MLIAHGKDVRLGIFDIETYLECFDVGIYNPDTREWKEFQISAFKNDLFKIIKEYTEGDYDYWVSFNGISFDNQVLEFIVVNHQKWVDLSGLEICKKISDFSSLIIDNQNYGIFSPFKEEKFHVKVIDLFKIHHFDNEAKRTSLKWCEFMMNMDVEEMPVHFLKTNLTEEEIEQVIIYRRKDVMATLGLLYITLGDLDALAKLIKELSDMDIDLSELKDYKGKNKIQDRFDVQNVTRMNCLNWSDVKIGEEWNKLDYKIAENIKDDSQLFSKKIKYPYGQKFKNFFPKTMSFQTPELKKFVETFGNEYVKNTEQEFNIKIGSTIYTIAKGGIHSTEKNRKIICLPGWILRDADVGSQYPNSIVKLEIFAPHLKRTILDQFIGKIQSRITNKNKGNQLKAEGKEDEARPFMSIQEMLKLCLNGGLINLVL